MNRKTFVCVAGILSATFLAHSAQAANAYLQHNLVSDLAGVADHTDAKLVNPWGNTFSGTSPFWVIDNGTGLSTLYNSAGVASATVVTIPPPAGSTATAKPTGIVFNSTTGFEIAPGKVPNFIFSTEDGTISGWNSSVDATHAILKVDNSSQGAVYKGLALASIGTSPFLYAPNFYSGAIDIFDSTYAPVSMPGAFADPAIPSGFAPFNIMNLGGKLYVAYAKQNALKHDDVSGPGNGYVDVFDTTGKLLQHLISGGALNSPWGIAIASANFGDFSNDLLVGNFGDGLINAFDPATGKFLAVLQDKSGSPIHNTGLWDLHIGNGGNGGDNSALYFTAEISGPNGGVHGLLGSIQAAPAATAAANGASFQSGIAPNAWISIFGTNLAATTRIWQNSDIVGGKLPPQLDGVSVTVDGKPAYVYFVSPKQLDVLVPVDSATGPVQIQTSSNGLTGATISAQMQQLSPAFFISKSNFIAATHADGTPVGATTLFPNASTPAKPGETIVLYGTGFGPTTPAFPDGLLVTTPYLLPANPTIMFGNTAAQVPYAGLTGAGLYQFNVTVPATTPDGDIPVVAQMGGLSTPSTALITVQH